MPQAAWPLRGAARHQRRSPGPEAGGTEALPRSKLAAVPGAFHTQPHGTGGEEVPQGPGRGPQTNLHRPGRRVGTGGRRRGSRQMAADPPIGRGEARGGPGGHAHLLRLSDLPPEANPNNQRPGEVEPGDQAPHARRPDLSQPRLLPQARNSPLHRAERGVGVRQTLPRHDPTRRRRHRRGSPRGGGGTSSVMNGSGGNYRTSGALLLYATGSIPLVMSQLQVLNTA